MDFDIIRKLKAKRKEFADREGKELYRVFSNETLELTAAVYPKTKAELTLIKGWGPKKIAAYGDQILALFAGGASTSLPDEVLPLEVQGAREPGILSVAQFLDIVNLSLARMGSIKVRGELSDVSGNGMAFFDLKDAEGTDAIAKCFLGRWQYERFSHLLEAGLEVVITGRPSVYKSGSFRIVVESIEPVGEGALQKAFEALKKKLEAKGYFASSRKRALPEIIRTIGVITSETGAVINDFRRNIGEFGFRIELLDVRVEGDESEESIVSAIRWFNVHRPELDVLVLMRGGGGLESMRAFNSEGVAEAIVTSRLPLITGIGHEKDETIAGYVSDKNFSTPTAVANFIRQSRETMLERVEFAGSDLIMGFAELMAYKEDLLARVHEGLIRAFQNAMERYGFVLRRLAADLAGGLGQIFASFHTLERRFASEMHAYYQHIGDARHRVDRLSLQSLTAMLERQKRAEARLEVAEAALLPLSPTAILERGYSVVADASGKVIKNGMDVRIGELLQITLSKGKIDSRVEKIQE
jgi:exodeoxyribonuclease VII large subunit